MKHNRIFVVLGWCALFGISGVHTVALGQTVGKVDEVDPGERVVVVSGHTYSVDPVLIRRPWPQGSERIEASPVSRISEISPGQWVLYEARSDVIERLAVVDAESIDQPASVIEPPVRFR